MGRPKKLEEPSEFKVTVNDRVVLSFRRKEKKRILLTESGES
jgi:hypothetical protein